MDYRIVYLNFDFTTMKSKKKKKIKITAFNIASKIKYLEINLTKEVQDSYTKNYMT